MLYVIAILLPPVGMLLCGNWFQALMCFLLMCTCLGWPIASVWALLVVQNYYADQRAERMVRELKEHS